MHGTLDVLRGKATAVNALPFSSFPSLAFSPFCPSLFFKRFLRAPTFSQVLPVHRGDVSHAARHRELNTDCRRPGQGKS